MNTIIKASAQSSTKIRVMLNTPLSSVQRMLLQVAVWGSLCVPQLLFGQDSLLVAYLSLAEQNNPLLAQHQQLYQMAQAKIDENMQWKDPTFHIGYGLLPIETRLGANRLQLSASQPFEWFGTGAAQKEQAMQQADAQQHKYNSVKNQVFLRIHQAYYKLYSIQEQIQVQEEAHALLVTWLAIVRAHYEQGRVALSDLLQLEMQEASSKIAIEQLQHQQQSEHIGLNQQLGDTAMYPLRIADTLPLPTVWPVLDVALSPVMQQIAAEQLAAQAQETLAYKQGLPTFQIGLTYALITKNESAVAHNGRDALIGQLGIRMPIYRKKYNVRIQMAQLQGQALQAHKQASEEALLAAHAQAELRAQQAQLEIQEHTQQIAYTNQIIHLRYTDYLTGQRSLLDLLEIQQRQLNHQLKKAQAIGAFYQAWSELKYLSNTYPFDKF